MVKLSPKQYVKKYFPLAVAIGERYGLPIDVLLAQSALESTWQKNAWGNNFFGIKATKDWTGEKQYLWTTEYIGGVKTAVQSWFRAYPTAYASWNDYALLITKLKRYRNAIAVYKETGDSIKYIYEIAAAGYATKPKYAKDLTNTLLYMIRPYMPYYSTQRAGLGGLFFLALLGGGIYYLIQKNKQNGTEVSDI